MSKNEKKQDPGASGSASKRGRMKQLDDWLEQHSARRLWHRVLLRERTVVEGWSFGGWSFGGRVAVIMRYRERVGEFTGWDIFMPADSALISATLADAEKRLGLTPATPAKTDEQEE